MHINEREKRRKIEHFDRLAGEKEKFRQKNRYYYRLLESFLGTQLADTRSVLEIGCAAGAFLGSLSAPRRAGIDFSPEMIKQAQAQFPESQQPDAGLAFRVDDVEALQTAERFDYVIMSDVIGELSDVWTALHNLHQVTHRDSRVIITYFNHLWEPLLRLGEMLHFKTPQFRQNWLSLKDMENLLYTSGFEAVHKGYRLLLPKNIPILSGLCNRYLAKLPLLEKLSLVTYLVVRPVRHFPVKDTSVTVVVPCRNERGNIRDAVERIPNMGTHTEILFVDGNSNDGTVEEIEATIKAWEGRKTVKLLHQAPPGSRDGQEHGKMLRLGKGDAVRKGFAAAAGEVLMILDADLTVPPEDLPKFYAALIQNKGEFINGSRLVYPMEKQAMRTLNKIANKFFGILFTWILGQRVTDTLCGTKVLYKKDYLKIMAGRAHFGDFDPFGDFDLLFGAARQNLKIVEIPIRYRDRTYGEVKISRFRHGLILLKMSIIGLLKLKLQ
ncbi:MAG: glycosyltransferase [Gammaproteobacteria bacterium]|nr:glycosyltransferase [Gammaproteobacteria bacterium]